MSEILSLPIKLQETNADKNRHSPEQYAGNVEPLRRHFVGDFLREVRLERGETLAQVANRAGVSPQYLSEIERGLKEPSSEMLAAIGKALGITLLDLTSAVSSSLHSQYYPNMGVTDSGVMNAFAFAA